MVAFKSGIVVRDDILMILQLGRAICLLALCAQIFEVTAKRIIFIYLLAPFSTIMAPPQLSNKENCGAEGSACLKMGCFGTQLSVSRTGSFIGHCAVMIAPIGLVVPHGDRLLGLEHLRDDPAAHG